jgi:hypothetical protein
MTPGATTEQETVRQIVRGQRPLTDLALAGMLLRVEGTRCQVDNPRRVETAVDVRDVAQGFLSYLHDPVALRLWALFLQAADVDLETGGSPEADTVLTALWDAAFGNPIAAETIAALRRIDQGDGHPA